MVRHRYYDCLSHLHYCIIRYTFLHLYKLSLKAVTLKNKQLVTNVYTYRFTLLFFFFPNLCSLGMSVFKNCWIVQLYLGTGGGACCHHILPLPLPPPSPATCVPPTTTCILVDYYYYYNYYNYFFLQVVDVVREFFCDLRCSYPKALKVRR